MAVGVDTGETGSVSVSAVLQPVPLPTAVLALESNAVLTQLHRFPLLNAFIFLCAKDVLTKNLTLCRQTQKVAIREVPFQDKCCYVNNADINTIGLATSSSLYPCVFFHPFSGI